METIKKMFNHLHWANQRLLAELQNMKGEHPQAIRLFAHILYAEQVWFTRLQGKDSAALPLWEDAALEECSQLVERNHEQITLFFTQLTESQLDDMIRYSNSKGQPFETSIRDVLTHVSLHGQYHRGQINARLRNEDVEPINVDYITFVR